MLNSCNGMRNLSAVANAPSNFISINSFDPKYLSAIILHIFSLRGAHESFPSCIFFLFNFKNSI